MMSLKGCLFHKNPNSQRASSLSQTANLIFLRCGNKTNSTPTKRFLLRNTPQNSLSLFLRSFSTQFPSRTSSTEQDLSKTTSAFDEVLKLGQNPHIQTAPLSGEKKDLLKKVRLSFDKENAKNDFLQKFLRSFPEDTDPNQLLEHFAEKLGHKEITGSTYSRMIHTFSLGGEFNRAQGIFDLMVANGLKPDEKTYCSLMNAYSNGGKLEKTIEIFKLLTDSESENHYPYAILIKAYMNNNQVQTAFNVVASMKKKMKPSVQVYNSLIQACLKVSDYKRVWAAYELMLNDDVLPNEPTYSMLISICREQNVKKAMDLFEDLLKRGISPNQKTITSLLAALCSEPFYYPKAAELLITLSTQKVFRPNAATFNTMLRGACVSKKFSDARRFFYQLQKYHCEPKDLRISFSAIFEAYAGAFAVDRIERFADVVEQETLAWPDFSFLKAPAPNCIHDCVNEAAKLIPFLEKLPASENSIHILSRPWTSFLFILTNYNFFDEAMKWFGIISKKFNHQLHSNVYTCMLDMCARLRKKEAFFTILECAEVSLAPIGFKSSLSKREKIRYMHVNLLNPISLKTLYRSIICGLTELNHPNEAMNYFEAMSQNSSISWRDYKSEFKPFLHSTLISTDSKLKQRLDQML